MKTRLFAALAFLGLAATPVDATTANFGYIAEIWATANGAVLFNTTGTRSGTLPSCQGPGLGQRFAIDASTTAGQAMASALYTAYSLHKRIWISGTGTCTIWSDTETAGFIQIEP